MKLLRYLCRLFGPKCQHPSERREFGVAMDEPVYRRYCTVCGERLFPNIEVTTKGHAG